MNKIPVSWLADYAYCEYQIYLEHVKGVDMGERPEGQRDREGRVICDEVYKALAEIGLGVGEALAKAQREGITLSARGVVVEGIDLAGCIDEVVFMPDRVLVVDDRPGDIAWPSSRMQAWGYCLAFEEQYDPQRPLMAGIRNSDTGFEIWVQPFTEQNRNEIRRAILRIRQILDGVAIPVATRNPRKCRACRFAISCDARSP